MKLDDRTECSCGETAMFRCDGCGMDYCGGARGTRGVDLCCACREDLDAGLRTEFKIDEGPPRLKHVPGHKGRSPTRRLAIALSLTGQTQTDLARSVGIAQSHVSAIVGGGRYSSEGMRQKIEESLGYRLW